MSWSEERVEQLKTLWAQGYSATRIAGKLRHVSRSAVLCKVSRLGLPARETRVTVRGSCPHKQRNKSTRQRRNAGRSYFGRPRKYEPPKNQPADNAILTAEIWQATPGQTIIPLIDLEKGMCRWPLGDPLSEEFGYCGAQQAPGVCFCAHHARLAYKPEKRRRK